MIVSCIFCVLAMNFTHSRKLLTEPKLFDRKNFSETGIKVFHQGKRVICAGLIVSLCLFSFSSRCVLAGDHLQLPPTILSKEAAKRGLEVTLMERLIKMLGDGAVCMLTTQYRFSGKL